MSDTFIKQTVSNAVFQDGASLSGTYTVEYDASGNLLAVTAVDLVATSSLGSTTFTGLGPLYTNTDPTTGTHYEIHNFLGAPLTGPFGGLYLDFKGEDPTHLSVQNYNGLYTSIQEENSDGSYTSYGLTSGGTVTSDVICYLRGTRILTPTGQVEVENLSIGDTVVTRFGAVQPIMWIGRQSFGRAFVRNNREQIPVRIAAGALGEMLPARDLFVSPGHSMLVDGRLVLAKSLINGITITQDEAPDEIHYYQIELKGHDCVLAEGAWSETYADACGMRAAFHNAATFHKLYPDYQSPEHPQLCASRPQHGAALDEVIRPIVLRASALVDAKPGPLRGWVDLISKDWISGWAQDQDYADLPVTLEVVVGDRVVHTVLACDYRQDLVGMGRGFCSFAFEPPAEISQDELGLLQVRRAGDGTALPYTSELRSILMPTSLLGQAA